MPVRLQLQTTGAISTELMLNIIARAPATMMRELIKAVINGSQILIAQVGKQRFTGGAPHPFPVAEHRLRSISGHLRRSLTHSAPAATGDGEVTVKMGSNIRYFAVHEFGFSGSVRVKAHQRQGRQVKEHQRSVRVPAREPLQTGIREHGARVYSNALAREIQKLVASIS